MKKEARRARPREVQSEQKPAPSLKWMRPWMVLILALLILAPFLDKALTIDDPLFVWQARHLQQKPFDPFGFEANWFGVPRSMLVNVQNPPLTCYWLALAGLVSWKEVWLHFAMLPFPLLAIWGVIQLARRLGADPLWAALLTLGSVGFLVSATNLMCDIMLTCGFIWSILLWIKGLDRNNIRILMLAAFLAGLTALTKYFGISLIPLLAAYTIIRQRKVTRSLAPLLATIALLIGWHFWTMHLYDVSHVFGAMKYAENVGKVFSGGTRYFASITFLGGCIFWPLVIMLWRVRSAGRILIAASAILAPLILLQFSDRLPVTTHILAAVFFAAGIAVFWMTGEHHIHNGHSPESWLIGLWIWGTLFFMIIVNWTVAARSLLPMIPALAILATMPGKPVKATTNRKNSLNKPAKQTLPVKSFATAAVLGLALALLATWADFDWANSIRRTAKELTGKYQAAGKQVYFHGHWGFQYYMELAGATIQDIRHIIASPNVVTILPFNNSNIYPDTLAGWQPEEIREERIKSGFYLTDPKDSAGFYSHILGVIPLAYAPGKPDVYFIMKPPLFKAQSH
jgi:4-amino-4-deoxy-L-arabinose transferase-like glycosyltransferase